MDWIWGSIDAYTIWLEERVYASCLFELLDGFIDRCDVESLRKRHENKKWMRRLFQIPDNLSVVQETGETRELHVSIPSSPSGRILGHDERLPPLLWDLLLRRLCLVCVAWRLYYTPIPVYVQKWREGFSRQVFLRLGHSEKNWKQWEWWRPKELD